MYAKDMISEAIPALQPTETGLKGLHWMDIFRISHLPVVFQDDYLGLLSDVDIFDHNMVEDTIGTDFKFPFKPFVYEYQHLYEVVEIASRLDLSVVPVLTEDNKYLGMISPQQLIRTFGELASVKTAGGILVLELNVVDYQLSQIAGIVEENDAKILSCYISSQPDSVKMEVTLKINRSDLTSIIQTFIRYEYTIKASFQSRNHQEEVLRSNYDQFMMYLNV
jgi:predicted transcriptional regulator